MTIFIDILQDNVVDVVQLVLYCIHILCTIVSFDTEGYLGEVVFVSIDIVDLCPITECNVTVGLELPNQEVRLVCKAVHLEQLSVVCCLYSVEIYSC